MRIFAFSSTTCPKPLRGSSAPKKEGRLEIFKSKSKAIAIFVDQTILSREELFERILTQVQEIATKREAAKHLAYQAVMAGRKRE
ncbi:MAG: hypothetical protein ACFFD9_03715 [Candidatus Thorarchaeota archaeon]